MKAAKSSANIYTAFFNYATGLERLLKILLLLDKWHRERKFLTNGELKAKSHGVENLYKEARALFPHYAVPWKDTYEQDEINRDLLSFLAGFANGNRYYNLDVLAGAVPQDARNPIYCWQRLFYRAYEQDHPKAEPIVTKPDVPEDSMSDSELFRHHVIIPAARQHICWRLVQLLIPLQALLIAIREQVQRDDLAFGGEHADPSVPFMEEFLDFVCEDKTIVFEPDDWPY